MVLWVNSGILGDQAVRCGRHLKEDDIRGRDDLLVVDEAIHHAVLQGGIVSLVMDNKEECFFLLQNPPLQDVHLVSFAATPRFCMISLGGVPDHMLLHLAAGEVWLNVLQELLQLVALDEGLESFNCLSTWTEIG